MADQVKSGYHVVQNPYCQTVADHPAVNVVIENSEMPMRKSSNNEQQRLASQRPRGTRIDDTGTRIQVKGGRNYTSRKLYISREEMFDDVVVRGLRADGLSTKLGVKNHKDGIRKLLSELFHGDSRLPVIEEHFRTHRQKSNCAKTMFSTMTHEELQFLKAETFPSRIDVQVRDYLTSTFADQPQKLQSTVEVLGQVQQIFKLLTPHADFLSSHNFQTRGFFLDIILMTCSFLMQIIQDSDGNTEPASNSEPKISSVRENKTVRSTSSVEEKVVKENKTAAEILLSVGSDILDNSEKMLRSTKQHQERNVIVKGDFAEQGDNIDSIPENNQSSGSQTMPTTVVVEGPGKTVEAGSEEWTTVEMLDANGNARYVLIKSNAEGGESFDTVKILNLLQSQGVALDDKIEIALTSQNSSKDERRSSPEDELNLDDVLHTNDENLVIDISTAERFDSELKIPHRQLTTDHGAKSNQSEDESQTEGFVTGESSTETEEKGSSQELALENKRDDFAGKILKEPQKRTILSTSQRSARKRSKLDG